MAAKLATMKRTDTLKQNHTDAQICATTQDEAAGMLNVSRRSVQLAREVIDHGTDELCNPPPGRSALSRRPIRLVSAGAEPLGLIDSRNPDGAGADVRNPSG